jgi:hypothetical protein
MQRADLQLSNEKKEFEEKMNLNTRSMKRATGLLSVLLAGFLLAGCSQTAAPGPSQAAQAPSEPAAPPPPMTSVQPSQPGAARGQYEEPPVVNVADLLPATPLSGPGYAVQPQAPTNGAMGQYTIVADASVFEETRVPITSKVLTC